jgi:hypothetical protein
LDPGNKHRSLHLMKQEREERIQIYFGWRADKTHLPTLIRLTGTKSTQSGQPKLGITFGSVPTVVRGSAHL